MFIAILFIFLVSDSVMCWNSTQKYMSMDSKEARSKENKLFSFHTMDEEIALDLEFGVPFIKIPVKKSVDMAKGAMANINVGALLLAGVVTVSASVVLPALLTMLDQKIFAPHSYLETSSYSPYRTTDSSDMWRYLAILDNALMDINIDTTSCVQRTLCSTVKSSSSNVNRGHGSSMDKIVDGLASNEWLQRFISNTPFFSAMKNGLDDRDCGQEYDKCTISKGTLHMIVKKFVKLINGDQAHHSSA